MKAFSRVISEATNHVNHGVAEGLVYFTEQDACRLVMPLLAMELAKVIGLGFYDEELANIDEQERAFLSIDSPSDIANKTRATHSLPLKMDKALRKFNEFYENRVSWCFDDTSYTNSFRDKGDTLALITTHLGKMRQSIVTARKINAGYAVWEAFRKRYINALNAKSSGWIPPELVHLCTQILSADYFHAIHDPFAGASSLLLDAACDVRERPSWSAKSVYTGFEANTELAALAQLSVAFTEKAPDAFFVRRDSFKDPQLDAETGLLQRYANIITNLSFGLPSEGNHGLQPDPHERFPWGVPSSKCPELTRLLHVISILGDEGRAVCLIRPSALEQAGINELIRGKIIEQNLIETVIRLPRKVIPGATAGACILVLSRTKNTDEVTFVDATLDYKAGRAYNALTEPGIKAVQLAVEGAKEGWPLADSELVAKANIREIHQKGNSLSVAKYIAAKSNLPSTSTRAGEGPAQDVGSIVESLQSSMNSFDESVRRVKEFTGKKVLTRK